MKSTWIFCQIWIPQFFLWFFLNFSFENHAGALKRKVRSGKSIPSQVHNRRTEYRKYIRFEKVYLLETVCEQDEKS